MNNAFLYAMGGGFPGDVNRTHPAVIEAVAVDTENPPTAYGQAVVLTAGGKVRRLLAEDTSSNINLSNYVSPATVATVIIYGVTVRPFPAQQSYTPNYCGAVDGNVMPPQTGYIDVLRQGYINVSSTDYVAEKGQKAFVCLNERNQSEFCVFSTRLTIDRILVTNAKYNCASDSTSDQLTELVLNIPSNDQ